MPSRKPKPQRIEENWCPVMGEPFPSRAGMTPQDRDTADIAEYLAEPSPEWEEERERRRSHNEALLDFGGLVPSPVADQQTAWLKSREDTRKAAVKANEDKKAAYREYRKQCLRLMLACTYIPCSAVQAGRARWYKENTEWPSEWIDEPRQSAKVPSVDTIKRRLLPALDLGLRSRSRR